jgi:hypothetical protein
VHDLPNLQRKSTPALRTDRACRIVAWKPWSQPNLSLLGHCVVAFTGGWVVHSIPVFRHGDHGLSVGVPSAAQLDADGCIKLRDGKRQYTAVLSFETTEARERWQRLVLTALADAGIGGAP